MQRARRPRYRAVYTSLWSNLKNNIANFDKSQQGLGVTVLQSMFNSFKVAVPFTVLSVYFSSMTAYGIHNYSFKGRKAAWAFIMGVMMVPTQVFAIGFLPVHDETESAGYILAADHPG